jgi:alkaline phosphatase
MRPELPRRAVAVLALCFLIAGVATGGEPPDGAFLQGEDPWFRAGQKALAEAQKLTPLRGHARNIILFVGDGMSVTTVTAARIFEGQRRGEPGEENLLSFERLPFTALAKTYNTNMQVPDSAGTITAMLTGVKTKAGLLGVSSGVVERDCASAAGNHVTTAAELAERAGMSTGVVSTTAITHATPAGAYAHSPSRGWQVDGSVPEEAQQAGCVDIARQLVEFPYGDGLDVVLGGGRRNFFPEGTPDPEVANDPGRRDDGRDLTEEWLARPGARYVWNLEQFQSVESGPLLGLFQPYHMQYETDRLEDAAGEPALSVMTRKAVEILARNPKGYFLLVEGGRIDHAHHASNAYRALEDTLEFARAVQAAMDATDAADTLIVVTADHSHTLTFGGYPMRGNPILGHVRSTDRRGEPNKDLEQATDGLPYTTLGYANGPGHRTPGKRRKTIGEDPTAPDYQQQAGIGLDWETHGGDDVAVYARGPGAQLVRGVIEQSYIFHVMDAAGRLRQRAAAAK